MMKKVEMSICPNPICEKAFENLIVIDDNSKKPPEKFYGCPFCFFKLDPIITSSLKKIEKMVDEETPCVTHLEEEIVSNCPRHLGYLADHFSDSVIPIQCLDCEKMNDCMKYHNDNKK